MSIILLQTIVTKLLILVWKTLLRLTMRSTKRNNSRNYAFRSKIFAVQLINSSTEFQYQLFRSLSGVKNLEKTLFTLKRGFYCLFA